MQAGKNSWELGASPQRLKQYMKFTRSVRVSKLSTEFAQFAYISPTTTHILKLKSYLCSWGVSNVVTSVLLALYISSCGGENTPHPQVSFMYAKIQYKVQK